MGRPGRPPKALKALHAQFCDLLRKGAHRKHAAAQIGLTEAQVSEWYHKGAREKKGIYREFHLDVNRAEADYADTCLAMITAQGASDPRVVQWALSRRFPELYGRRDNVDDKSPEDRAAQTQATRQLLMDRLKRLRAEPAPAAPAAPAETADA